MPEAQEKPSLPPALVAVAVLFILAGAWAVVDILVRLTLGQIYLNLNVLGLFVGIGLLKLRPGWRICALVLIWVAIILLSLLTPFLLMIPGPLTVSIMGQPVGMAHKAVAIFPLLLIIGLAVWSLLVLTRDDVKALFGVQVTRDAESGGSE